MSNASENIENTFAYLTKNAIPIKRFGLYAAITKNRESLFYCPMLVDGSPEMSEDYPDCYNFIELSAPEADFLDIINSEFGTNFTMSQFSGR